MLEGVQWMHGQRILLGSYSSEGLNPKPRMGEISEEKQSSISDKPGMGDILVKMVHHQNAAHSGL
jgi:hypothetical protein